MTEKCGCVYLIGAGCGEGDLITLRGLERLQACDVIVYDDLIDTELLRAAPEGTPALYMGKRLGRHSARQEDISQTLVQLAREGKRVARLKGGDPFVFGRGGEEALALQAAGVPFEEIPGISSCIAIPALAGIPVTHRGISRGFHVITANTNETEESLLRRMEHLASLEGTLVFLMGLGRLEEVVQGLLRWGKAAQTPAAVVSGGNAPHPMVVRATLETIAERTRALRLQPPAVIVVGETAAMDLTSPVLNKPLAGVRVGVTGTVPFTQKLCRALREQGAQTTVVQQSLRETLAWRQELESLLDGSRHWLVFTSANGVRVFFDTLRENAVDLRRLATCKFAVIGSATGAVLSHYGFQADLCPREYTSEALAAALCKAIVPGEDVVLLRAQQSAAVLPEVLRAQGVPVQDIALYRVKPAEGPAVDWASIDYLTFGSAGGVHQFFAVHHQIPSRVTCVCIGAVTAKALAAYDGRSCLLAEEATVSGILEQICRHHQQLQIG